MLIREFKAAYRALLLLTAAPAFSSDSLGVVAEPPANVQDVAAPCLKQLRIRSTKLLSSATPPKIAQRPPKQAGIPERQEAIELCDLNLPGNPEALIQALLPLLNSQPLAGKVIEEIKQKIVQFYRENHRPVMMVSVPEQDISDGTLQLDVIEGCVGEVLIIGQKWTSESRIRKNIRLQCGDEIDSHKLLTDVQWLNQNPFRQTDIVFAPGKENGTTNIELITKDRFPVRIYAGTDNTGTPPTGRSRLFTGLNWGNAFGLDHILSFQYTTSDDFHKFRAYTGSYSIPLPWRHTFTVFGGYSSVRPHVSSFNTVGLKSLGWSGQASGRYKIPLGQTYGNLQQDLQIGYDFKETNNNLLFAGAGTAIETNVVRLGQFTLGYHLSYLPPQHVLNFEWDVYCSPVQNWYGNQNLASYHKLQTGATPIYIYTNLGLSDDYALSQRKLHQGWRVFYQTRLQLSNRILLPSEQFSLGGYSTVRGYNERLVNYDNAACGNFEIRTPNLYPFRKMGCKNIHEAFYALAFLDCGYGWTHRHPAPHLPHVDPANHTLLGVGPGLRYAINRYLTARCDLGFPLLKVENNGTFPHIHFSVLVSY